MDERNINLTINLTDVFNYITSDIFDDMLKNSTTISNYLFIKNVLIQTVSHMIEEETE